MKKETTLTKRILLTLAVGLLLIVTMNAGTLGVQLSHLPMQTRELLSAGGLVLSIIGIWGMWRIFRPYQKTSDQSMNLKAIGISLGLFFLLRLVVIVFSLLIQHFSGETSTANDDLLYSLLEGLSPILKGSYYLVIAVIGPIAEEFFFRGAFTEILFKDSKKQWIPMVLASLFFSINHLSSNWISFTMYFTMGIILHLAYLRRKNIMDSILVHILNNSFGVLIMILMQAGSVQ